AAGCEQGRQRAFPHRGDERRLDGGAAPPRVAPDKADRNHTGRNEVPLQVRTGEGEHGHGMRVGPSGAAEVLAMSFRGSRIPSIARRLNLATTESASAAMRRLSAPSRLLSAVTT